MPLAFDHRPRGWTSYSGSYPPSGGCSSTWLLPEFQARAKADYESLVQALSKMTKPQLVNFMSNGGRKNFCGLQNKESLASTALMDQYMAWYPYMEDG